MFAFLGSIQIGVSPFTGPTAAGETEKSTLARIAVAEGKPVLQDMGDELIVKHLKFFFDETFCDPEVEMQKLREARSSRSPLAWSYGDGSYTGARYVVEQIKGEIKKTTPLGRIVRIEAELQLVEMPITDLSAMNAAMGVAGAVALVANAALNVMVKQ